MEFCNNIVLLLPVIKLFANKIIIKKMGDGLEIKV